jgi:oligosaccharide repeat unit polymerase
VRFAVLAAICVAVAAAVLLLGPTPPLLFLLANPDGGGNAFDLSLRSVRLAYMSQHAGGLPFQATLYQFYGNVMPLLSIIALALGSRLRSRRWLVVGLALFAVSLLMAAVTLTKNPVENLVVLLFVAWLWFQRRRLGPWQVSGMVAVALGAFFALVVATNRSVSLGAIVLATLRRLFLVQAQVLYSIYDLIPAKVSHLAGGALWMDVRNLRPGPKSTLDFGGWLYTQIVSSNLKLDSGVGSAPTVFYGQLYADFGVIAALVGMAVVGCLAQLAYVWYLRHPRTIVAWAVFVGLTASIPRLTTSSIIAIAVQYGIVASILLGLYFADWAGLASRLTRGRWRWASRSLPEPGRGTG